MTPNQLITYLNAIGVGEMDAIAIKLQTAREACLELEQTELCEALGEALNALRQADMKTYRRRVSSVIARLGHLK
ncbi:MAG: hypothetical protein GY716_19530 [bacterium]|nr:hypothetical protein [bacterium]